MEHAAHSPGNAWFESTAAVVFFHGRHICRDSAFKLSKSACLFPHHHRHHHHHGRVAGEGRRVVAPPCPRSTARLQSSPVGRVESFRSWSSHLFRGRPGGRRHVRPGGRLSDTLMWSRRAMFAGVTPSSRATCPNTEMRRRDRRWNSEFRPVR